MSLSLRRPSPQNTSPPTDRELLRDNDPISKFVNEDTDAPMFISSVNFNFDRNGSSHRTHFYTYMKDPEKNVLIVRRGQPFRITIGLSRKFCLRDYITLIFYCKDLCKASHEIQEEGITSISQTANVANLGSSFGNKTKIVVPIIATSHYTIKSSSKWDAVCDLVGNDSIQVLVQAADDCIIGRWLMSICVERDGVVSWYHETWKTTIYVIFNYTCKGDEVYLENTADRVEYVEETMGMIFIGCQQHVMINFWTFGQFDIVVLELALQMLLTTELPLDVADRCRASKVAQVVAHAVLQSNKFFKNGNQHKEDRWSSASRAIADYLRKKKPIVYFEQKTIAAVLTSIFRSLGIPARPVTGYNISTSVFSRIKLGSSDVSSRGSVISARMNIKSWSKQPVSSEKTLKAVNTDRLFLSENLKVFHPWVEIFILRKDLGDSYGGWQAISNDGPASVVAIQKCNYTLDHGTIAFCNQINNSCTHYSFNKTFQNVIPHNDVIGRIGNTINTKKAGVDTFGFVGIENSYRSTHEQSFEAYKFGYRTEYKRLMETHSTTPSSVISSFVGKELQGLTFHLSPIKSILLGEDIPVHVFATTNDQKKDWQATVSIHVFAVSPEGKLLKKVKKSVLKLNKMVEGGSAKLYVPYSEYGSKIQFCGMFKVIALFGMTGTPERFFVMDDFFIVSIPPLRLLVSSNSMSISLINTLPIPMKKTSVTLYELGDTLPNVKLKVPMLTETS